MKQHGLSQYLRISGLITFSALLASSCVFAADSGIVSALESGQLGFYPAQDFRLTDGKCSDCPVVPQALWYFRDDLVAVPRDKAAGFSRHLQAQEDVRQWIKDHPDNGENTRPPLLWLGSPLVAQGVRLYAAGDAIQTAGAEPVPFKVTPKIASNQSYYDKSTVSYFSGRSLRMRGKMEDATFVARTIWPDDFALDFAKLPYEPLANRESLTTLVRADGPRAKDPLEARIVWQRNPQAARDWSNKPVLAVMLNGAQGDDDEAHGGHFAIVTGSFSKHGEWGDWLVNNFYNLDSNSEKGINASILTMDAYMADLNSGQSWYRPSYMLVAVLKNERTSLLYQEAVSRVYNHFYRHDFHYRHAIANCAGISIETLRSLGWRIPEHGPTSFAKAIVAFPYKALADMSIDSGRKAFDYLTAEQTNLFPFVAFDAVGRDLMQRIVVNKAGTNFERMLAEDVEALIYVRIPQFPSSRAFGQAPVASIDEYMERVPKDHKQWKIVPATPRLFPAEFRDAAAPSEPQQPSAKAQYAYLAVVLLLLFSLVRIVRKRFAGKSDTRQRPASYQERF